MWLCNTQDAPHASDHWWWAVFLWPRVEAARTRSGSADHSGVLLSCTDRTGARRLRVTGVAPPQRIAEGPRVLSVPAGLARSRMAALATVAASPNMPRPGHRSRFSE